MGTEVKKPGKIAGFISKLLKLKGIKPFPGSGIFDEVAEVIVALKTSDTKIISKAIGSLAGYLTMAGVLIYLIYKGATITEISGILNLLGSVAKIFF